MTDAAIVVTGASPNVHVRPPAAGLEEGASVFPDGQVQEVVRSPEGPEEVENHGDPDAGDVLKIIAAIDAVDIATMKTTRLSRRPSRVLQASAATEDAGSDDYASVLVLSGHVDANHRSATYRARRTSEHVAAVRVQAGAIVKAVRAVETLNACVERNQSALEVGPKLHNALDEAIQDDDGDLTPVTRRDAQDCRSEASIVVAVTESLIHRDSDFRKDFKDLTPADIEHGLLTDLIAQSTAEDNNFHITMSDLSTAISSDVYSDAETQQDQQADDGNRIDDMDLDREEAINQTGASGVAQPLPLISAAELADKTATDDALSAMINASPTSTPTENAKHF